jgi:hypothetical protein
LLGKLSRVKRRVGAQVGFGSRGARVSLTGNMGSSGVAFGLSELRWDNEKGYRLRGDGVGVLLGEMRDEVGLRKTEAPCLTGIAIHVVVEYGKECGFGLVESSCAQHGDQRIAMK